MPIGALVRVTHWPELTGLAGVTASPKILSPGIGVKTGQSLMGASTKVGHCGATASCYMHGEAKLCGDSDSEGRRDQQVALGNTG